MKRLTLLVLCAALAAAQDKPADQEAKLGRIAGTVTAGSGGPPMKDVEIHVNRNTPQAKMAVTDQQGRYAIGDVAPGQIRISASAPDSSGRVGFGPGDTRQITLAAGQELNGVDFRLVIQGRISGKVVDENREPVVGLAVFLVAREYSHGALRAVFTGVGNTDDQGAYRLERVQPGRAYAVLAQRRYRGLPPISDSPLDPELRLPAVVPTYYPNARSMDGAELQVLRPGEQREGVDIRLTRSAAFCLDGVLEGASGPGALRFEIGEPQPASGRVGAGGFYMSVPGGTSGPDGKVRICDLHPGEYELTVSEQSPGGMSGRSQFGATIVTIGDRDVAGVRLGLRRRIPVSGEVVFDGPAPEAPLAAQLRLNVETITRTERGNAQVSIPGEFDFSGGLLMDEYGLDITGMPTGIYIKDLTYGGRSMLYQTLRVGSALGNAGLRVILGRDGGSVGARVADKDGNPVADCTVAILPVTAASEAVFAAALKTGKTNQTGVWSSATLVPGKYYVLATNDTIDRSPETIGRLWKSRNRGEEVELAPNGKLSVALTPKSLD
ncbi:MAG: carboxypeptidase-like regulatory domain-containing protein [Candidatus Solibacter sp.]|nr:carboxypeptidase-like regulatory domain-containing protein [Candidatus Solibacter sp.]